MKQNISLGLGPMSVEIVKSINSFSIKYNKKIMIICSRNQIETEKLGGGYVNNFTTNKFSNFIEKMKNNNLIICRDHSGPYKKDNKIKKKLTLEIDDCKKSLEDDIKNNFKIIHIDTSECKSAKYEIAKELINFCNEKAKILKKKIKFEFGSEKHGILTSLKDFKKDINFFNQFHNRQYIVCQTGSLVKSIFQVGQFDSKSVADMKKIALKHGVELKEHNCDYLNKEQFELRKLFGINAINIAPEMGFLQTNLIYLKSKQLRLDKYFNNFFSLVLKKNKWKKWNYNKENNYVKFLSAGHYHYNSKEYNILKEEIDKKISLQKLLDGIVENNLYKYFN
jgi:hypothetical protein